ncbi:hypothetical protein J5N97_015968 [Dioscorea zingiberensis]|uniref:Carbohydrate kinase PfkB domain-containing protein n=1 Tax=Dioscorea zingiberensis TaxID=325984 RepID=A0A9D5CK68_9LILI|nr:hypothetical protein J5N97_015968 [Dioscorea zingiberensis]
MGASLPPGRREAAAGASPSSGSWPPGTLQTSACSSSTSTSTPTAGSESLTGISNPIRAGQELIKKGSHTKWVIIKMGGKGSILITKSSIACAPAFKVDVVDTVGCGDSFTAATAYGFLHDLSPLSTLVLANAVGAATAMGCGAGRNVADLDKILKLLRQSDLNEDDHFWHELTYENLETPEILLLSKEAAINGQHKDGLVHMAIQHALSELLPKLHTICHRNVLAAMEFARKVASVSYGDLTVIFSCSGCI